jgi:thiol-disulfide isomerase/thioredoxin
MPRKSGGSDRKARVYKFYADWCGYCIAMRPAWQATKRAISKDKNIEIVEVESDDMHRFEKRNATLMKKIRSALVGRLTYPTIVSVSPSGKARQFTGARTTRTMTKFIRDSAASI